MPLVDLEVTLNDQERAIRGSARRFAQEVMRPAGAQLDRLADPAAVIAPESVLWDVFKKYWELQLDVLDSSGAELSPADHARLRFLTAEEMGWGDAGLAISLGVSGFHKMFAQMSGRPALMERFGSPDNRDIGCWAVTEPDHGSDSLTVTERHFGDPRLKANCVARREGDAYVISGQKAAWVSNGTIATVATLFCTIDQSQGFKGGGVCIVPLDLQGVSRGKPLDKLGQRALNQGEIFFDDVRIPADYMIVGPDAYAAVVEAVLTVANASMGAIFVGLGRAALEYALAYAKERVQGGVPIFEHQSVKARLFKIFTQVEAARSLAWRVMIYNTANPPQVQYSIASKVFCTNTAFEAASGALQIYGGNGLSREYPIEKLLRDARASMIEDGCNDVLSLVGAAKL
ncbi:MAG TPA: acyl-CoA dehydrogenase family protein [Candidatus Margulisiibacteriota bacterium]|nr:acyl-CoA dehydrogenase family protein [Candidatus Margulisiibacteriota bacterium]